MTYDKSPPSVETEQHFLLSWERLYITITDDLSNLSSKRPIVVASLLLRNSYQSQPLLPHFQHLLDRQQLLMKVNLLQRPLEKLAMVPEQAEKQWVQI